MKIINRRLISAASETILGIEPGGFYTLFSFSKGTTVKIESDKIERDVISPTFTPLGSVNAGKKITVSGELELVPGGVNESGEVIPPDCGILLEACGLEKKATVSIDLDLVSGTFEIGETLQNATPINIGTIHSIDTGDGNYVKLWCIKNPAIPALFENDELTGVTSGATGQIIGTTGDTLKFVVVNAPSNTGDGTITSLTLDAAAKVGDYVLIITDTTTPGSEVWSVVDPDEEALTSATTGVSYDSAQIDFTVNAGGINWAMGDKITLSVNYGAAVETNLAYFPTSKHAEHKSVTIIDNIDGTKKTATYCRGNVSFILKVKDYVRMSFDFTGIYHDPESEALIDADFSENEPIICNPALFNIGNLDTGLTTVETFELNLNNEVQPVEDMQAEDAIKAIFITNRAPSGTINPTTVSLNDWNPFDEWKNHHRQKIFVAAGNERGKRIRISIPEAQLEVPDDSGDRNGIQVTNLTYTATGRKKVLFDRELSITIW